MASGRSQWWKGQGDDPHTVLGVPPGATPDEVTAAYRRQMLQHHPDVVAQADGTAADAAASEAQTRYTPSHHVLIPRDVLSAMACGCSALPCSVVADDTPAVQEAERRDGGAVGRRGLRQGGLRLRLRRGRR